MNRRRAMAILGAAALTSCRRTDSLLTFSDIAFGTEVGFQLHGISNQEFGKLTEECVARLREIESLFSLHDPDSAISRLNREGFIEAPQEFIGLLQEALSIGEKTGGLFDITVQPLWNWRQAWKGAGLKERREMEGEAWDKALSLVDHRKVSVDGHRVEFARKGMAITLNAIVQGYATDQIAALIRKHGVSDALVNIGEYYAIGNTPGGTPWKVELAATGKTVALPGGRALAVSAGMGYTFDPEGRFHHIFRPSDGDNPRPESTIVVTAPTATMADALSTTFAVANVKERDDVLGKFPEAELTEIP